MVKRDSPPILKDEKCWNCGKSVAWGSGRYVNRIPSLDSVEVRRENGAPHPEGEYLCSECEGEFEKGEIRCPKCGSFADKQEDGTSKCQLSCTSTKKLSIACPLCSAEIDYVEVSVERHGVMSIGGEIEYDLNSDNNGSPRYFCQCVRMR